MKPWNTVERRTGADQSVWLLQERDGEFVIRVNGHVLMSSRRHGSEEAMISVLAGGPLMKKPTLQVLIGGLGLGYTLRAALDTTDATACISVVEISKEVIAWNRGVLAHLTRAALEDSRVRVVEDDLQSFLRQTKHTFDIFLLDIDNGPAGLTVRGNRSLYSEHGIGLCKNALAPGGQFVVWSAGPDGGYLSRLKQSGFQARCETVRAHGTGKASHVLFIAHKP